MKKILFLCLILIASMSSANAQQRLDNDSICKMVKAGLTDDVIMATITATSGHYDLTQDAMANLKKAGVSDMVIAALKQKAAMTAPAPIKEHTADVETPKIDTRTAPRIFLTSENSGSSWGVQLHSQSLEIAKLFASSCPTAVISQKSENADYTMYLVHEDGLFSHNNQMQIYDRNGNIIAPLFAIDSTARVVKHACDAVTSDWTAKYAQQAPQRRGTQSQ